jgi:hypothetical protein
MLQGNSADVEGGYAPLPQGGPTLVCEPSAFPSPIPLPPSFDWIHVYYSTGHTNHIHYTEQQT